MTILKDKEVTSCGFSNTVAELTDLYKASVFKSQYICTFVLKIKNWVAARVDRIRT